jgi:PAS domain S-box-containing protein
MIDRNTHSSTASPAESSLLAALPDTILRIARNGVLVEVLSEARDSGLGHIVESAPKPLRDIFPPQIADRLTDLAARTVESAEANSFDFVLSRDERLAHHECRLVKAGPDDALAVIRDVTELKHAVAESNVILETIQGVSTTSNVHELLDHIHQSIGRYLYAENFLVVLYDAKNRSLDMEFFVDRYEAVPPPVRLGEGLIGYAFRTAEPMLLTADAIDQLMHEGEIDLHTRRPAAWLAVPLRTPKGPIGVLVLQHYEDPDAYSRRDLELLASIGDQIGVAIDRKRSEIEMFNAKSFLNRVIDNVPNLIYVKDRLGRYVLTNTAFAEMHGRDVKEVVGRTDHELLGGAEDAVRYDISDHFVLSTAQEYVNQEEKLTDASGGVRWLQSVKRPLMSDDGSGVEYILGIATDMTERKTLEHQLQQAQKLESIGQLAAGVAHEINTPTQYVGDNVRFLRDGFGDYRAFVDGVVSMIQSQGTEEERTRLRNLLQAADLDFLAEEIPSAFDQALDGVERIRRIVQSMKDFAHPGSNDFQAADLNRMIESTIVVASNEWKYVADVVRDYDEQLPPVPCLASEFNQVILNMIVNAAHAIAETDSSRAGTKGSIAVRTRVTDHFAEITIADTGTGMTEEVRKKIFDPFFTTKEVGKGTGQGLAISHTVIVEKHRGKIDVTSEPGRGTTFVIRIPLEQEVANTSHSREIPAAVA